MTNVKKQQMQLHLQQQPLLQLRPDRTGFETLLDAQARAPIADAGATWSPADAARYRQHRQQHDGRRGETDGDRVCGDGPAEQLLPNRDGAASPDRCGDGPPTSPLSLPSPYYDRNPMVMGFPPHHHHYHHAPKSPAIASAVVVAAAAAAVPLANVQNVAYADDQDHAVVNGSKYYHQRHQNRYNSYKPGDPTDGRDDDKENFKQQDAECLQQQLDEVLKACADYEERHKSRQQQSAAVVMPAESSGNTSPGAVTTMTTTPPQQNRIKTNGSLPRDNKKTGTSSPTKLSPTSPMSSSSITTFSPTSLSSMTWPTTGTTPSPPTLSPLSLKATNCDSVFSENDNNYPSLTAAQAASPSPNVARGSPRTRIKTLVPSSSAHGNTADLHCGGNNKDHQQAVRELSKSPERPLQQLSAVQPTLLQSPQPSSWQSTTTWLRSSPFATDATDGGVAAPSTAEVSAAAATARAAEAAERRRKLLIELSAHKSRLVELHLRREEVDREMIIETALLRAELDAADDETRQSDNIVDGLERAVAECRQQMDACTVKQQEQRTAADAQLAGHRKTLQGLRSRLESAEDDDDGSTKSGIRASIDKQTELLEAEQKLYEDVEFGLLEEEAGWLARREELHRDRAAAVAVRRARRARAEWLRAQLDQLRSVGDDQLRALRTDINAATLSIQQGHKKLIDLDAATGVQDQYRRLQFHYDSSSSAEHQQRSWDNSHLKSPLLSSSLSWDQRSRSPWYPATASNNNNSGRFPSSSPVAESLTNNVNSLMTSSMTTTCCSSIGSSGGEDDGCTRPGSEDSMSTIFDGGAGVKLRSKNKSLPSDMTKRPLTRYLPIRYDEDSSTENRIAFDLRAHIESAGHQLDDDGRGADRHFWIDSSSCRGYLKKLSGAAGKNTSRGGRKWLKRWFVFDRRSKTLCYYRRRTDEDVTVAAAAAEKKTRPRSSINFQDIQEVYVDHTNSSKGQGCAFVVKTAQRTFYLSAATGQAVRVWVDVIFTGAEGYREYLKGSAQNGTGRGNAVNGH